MKARAAYSDMIMALSVVRRLINDLTIAKEGQAKAQFKEYPVSPMKKQGQQRRHFPKSSVHASIQLDGIEILVVNDSMRQFATSQELISFSLGTNRTSARASFR